MTFYYLNLLLNGYNDSNCVFNGDGGTSRLNKCLEQW